MRVIERQTPQGVDLSDPEWKYERPWTTSAVKRLPAL
jgi:hypothetical protein